MILFTVDQVPLGWGKLRRQEDVVAEGGEQLIEGWRAGGFERWEVAWFERWSWLA